jgi:Xaa-Pro aminopeptidase
MKTVTGNFNRVRRLMDERGLDALVVASPENTPYLAGVLIPTQKFFRERLAIVLWPADGEPTLIVCDLELDLARAGTWIQDLRWYVEFQRSPIASLVEVMNERGLARGRVGVEVTFLIAKFWDELRESLPQVNWVPADDLLSEARVIKTEAEIELLSQANRATETAHLTAYQSIRGGESERELAERLMRSMLLSGADEVTFCYLNAGARTGMRHLRPGDYQVQPGDLIKCDAGETYKGYWSDIARTVAFGQPRPEQRDTYRKLYEVHQECIAAAKPGVPAAEIFRVQKDGFERVGLPFTVPHVGHSIGLEAHESPMLTPQATRALEPNMIIAIETRMLIPNKEGYHVEDVLQITETGARVLTTQKGTDDLLIME